MNMFRTLSVPFERQEEFEREFRENIARGGLFVATLEEFELREVIEIEIDLRFCSEKMCLQGEVVSRVCPDFESADTEPGVAVQLLDPAEQIRERLHELTGIPAPDSMPETWPGRPGPARRHSRAPAQIAIEVEWRSGAVDAEVENLSRSGILIAVNDRPIPIGEQVRVKIPHPRTGEDVELPGAVVRHHEKDGRVLAVAIEFSGDGEAGQVAAEIAEAIQAATHARKLGGITGSISALGVPSLLQMFSSSSTEGTFVVTDEDQQARVLFKHDVLRHVELGPVRGRKALSRLLVWQEGIFEFQPLILPGEPEGELGPMHAAVLEALQHVDELARLDTSGTPPHVVVRTAEPRPEAGALSELETAIYDLASSHATVQEILDGIQDYDSRVLGALLRLRQRGLIQL